MKRYIVLATITIILGIGVTIYEYSLRDKYVNDHGLLNDISTGTNTSSGDSQITTQSETLSGLATNTPSDDLISTKYLPLQENVDSYYGMSGDKVIFINPYSSEEKIITGADLYTFKSFSGDQFYGVDKSHVYMNGDILSGADIDSFELLFKKNYEIGDLTAYTKDKNHIYGQGIAMSGVDLGSFEVVDYMVNIDSCTYVFGKDKNNLYYFNYAITGVDLSSFEFDHMDENCIVYIKDKNHSYKLQLSQNFLNYHLEVIK